MASLLLTDSKIRGLKSKHSAYYTWQASATRGTGRLGLRTYPSGRKTFVYRYFICNKEKFITLGDFPSISLAEAKAKALDAASSLSSPEKIGSELASIQQLFDDYIVDQKKRGKRAYCKTRNRLHQVLASPSIDSNMLAKSVTPDHIKRVLAEVIARGALAGANKIRANLHAVFNFGLFSDNDPAKINEKIRYGLARNPVALVPAQKGADKALDRFLTWTELQKLLAAIRQKDTKCLMHPNYALLLQLCIFTGGQRPWELMTNLRANWDKTNNTLTVPPSISKNGDFHVIPLCETATNILISIEKNSPKATFLFPAETKENHLLPSEYAKQINRFCKISGFEKFTPRDIRRTFKTLAGEMGISSEMRDRLQNHKKAGVSTKHYDRYDYLREKREMITLWEAHLLAGELAEI